MRIAGLVLLCGYALLYVAVYGVWIHPLKRWWKRLPGAVVLLALFPLPMVAWNAAQQGKLALSYTAGGIAYLLLAPLLWHATWCALLLLLNALLYVFSHIPGCRLKPLGLKSFRRTLAVLLVLTIAYSLYETHHIRTAELVIRTPLLAPDDKPVHMVQIVDMHLDVYSWNRKSAPVIKKIAEINPDIVISTGDFLDAPVRFLEKEYTQWADVRPPLGKYAILGNHEGYKSLQNAIDFHDLAGFDLLRGQVAQPLPWLLIAGVDDPAVARQTGEARSTDESALAMPADRTGFFTILLKHQPRVTPWTAGHVDLQLSGHTHGGQIFPFHILVAFAYPYMDGVYPISERGILYTSRGTGYWGPPFRLLAPPIITHIILTPED